MKKRANTIRKEERKAALESKRRKRGEEIATSLGIIKALGLLPKTLRDQILTSQKPKTQVILSPSLVDDKEALWAKEQIERFNSEVEWKFHDTDTVINIDDFFSVVIAMCRMMMRLRGQNRDEKIRYILKHTAIHVADGIQKFAGRMMAEMMFNCDYAMGNFSRLDKRFFYYSTNIPRLINSDDPLRFIISSRSAISEYIEVERGKPRECFRVGWGSSGMAWTTMRGGTFGLSDDVRLPVYIQKHALIRLHERLGLLDDVNHYFVANSIENLSLHTCEHDGITEHKAAFRTPNDKLGYLVLKLVDGKVVITTFLFLTMAGTPEQQKLYEKLRLTPSDLRWHQLHTVDAFVKTDLFDDPFMRQVLRECGCEPLERLREDFKGMHERKAVAGDLKKYMRLTPSKEKSLLEKLGLTLETTDERTEEHGQGS